MDRARVLPAFPAAIPVEAEIFQLGSDFLERRDGELDPHQVPYDLRLVRDFRQFRFQSVEERQGVHLAWVCCVHCYSLSAVHPLSRVASGLVTLTGSADGALFSSESRAAVWRRKSGFPQREGSR